MPVDAFIDLGKRSRGRRQDRPNRFPWNHVKYQQQFVARRDVYATIVRFAGRKRLKSQWSNVDDVIAFDYAASRAQHSGSVGAGARCSPIYARRLRGLEQINCNPAYRSTACVNCPDG